MHNYTCLDATNHPKRTVGYLWTLTSCDNIAMNSIGSIAAPEGTRLLPCETGWPSVLRYVRRSEYRTVLGKPSHHEQVIVLLLLGILMYYSKLICNSNVRENLPDRTIVVIRCGANNVRCCSVWLCAHNSSYRLYYRPTCLDKPLRRVTEAVRRHRRAPKIIDFFCCLFYLAFDLTSCAGPSLCARWASAHAWLCCWEIMCNSASDA